MNNKNETVADVVAWLRKIGDVSENLHDEYHGIADRIEAAHKREVNRLLQALKKIEKISRNCNPPFPISQFNIVNQHARDAIKGETK